MLLAAVHAVLCGLFRLAAELSDRKPAWCRFSHRGLPEPRFLYILLPVHVWPPISPPDMPTRRADLFASQEYVAESQDTVDGFTGRLRTSRRNGNSTSYPTYARRTSGILAKLPAERSDVCDDAPVDCGVLEEEFFVAGVMRYYARLSTTLGRAFCLPPIPIAEKPSEGFPTRSDSVQLRGARMNRSIAIRALLLLRRALSRYRTLNRLNSSIVGLEGTANVRVSETGCGGSYL